MTGENLYYRSAVVDDGVCLDIGFWGISHQRAYFDVRVFNPYAPSCQSVPASIYYCCNEQQKRRAYDQQVRDVEIGCFSPLVFSAADGCGPTADVVLKRLASCIATRQGKPYSHMLCWLRCHIGFSLMCSAVLCLRGCHSSPGLLPDRSMIDLAVHEGHLQP